MDHWMEAFEWGWGQGSTLMKENFYWSLNSPIHLLIVYSHTKLIFFHLTSTCRGKVFSLNSKEITMNPYVGMKKFSGSLFLSQDFFILPPLQKEYAIWSNIHAIQEGEWAVKSWGRELGIFICSLVRQFHQQESDYNEVLFLVDFKLTVA